MYTVNAEHDVGLEEITRQKNGDKKVPSGKEY